MSISLPVKNHPFNSTKTDFVVRGAAAELVLLINDAFSKGSEHPMFSESLDRWILLYESEESPKVRELVEKTKAERVSLNFDHARLRDFAQSLLE